MSDQRPVTLEVIAERIDNMGQQLGGAIGELKDVMHQIADVMAQQSALNERIEANREHHDHGLKRAFQTIEDVEDRLELKHRDHEERLRKVEKEQPILSLTSGWVLGGAAVIGVTVLAAALKILIH